MSSFWPFLSQIRIASLPGRHSMDVSGPPNVRVMSSEEENPFGPYLCSCIHSPYLQKEFEPNGQMDFQTCVQKNF
ncbi:Polycystin-1 [Manis pentadactyla]|nr:Polycystin-1 [Manis pentadactyla]